MSESLSNHVEAVANKFIKTNIPDFRPGDTVKVHARIVEGAKERIQVFQGVVIKRHDGKNASASFTVRKVSYNIGVERTFLLHSPRVEKIEVVSRGKVRRSRLFYLRPLRGKSTRIKRRLEGPTAKKTEEVSTAAQKEVAQEPPVTD